MVIIDVGLRIMKGRGKDFSRILGKVGGYHEEVPGGQGKYFDTHAF